MFTNVVSKVRFKALSLGLTAAVIAVFTVSGFSYLQNPSFGDERQYMVPLIVGAVRHGFSPTSYVYPTFYLGLSIVVLSIRASIFFEPMGTVSTVGYWSEWVTSFGFLWGMRLLLLMMSAIALIILFRAVFELRKNPWDAFMAVAIMGGSWEVLYHSVRLRLDSVVMFFGVLVIFGLVKIKSGSRKERWLVFSAAMAGLAAGSKYTGALLFIPVVVAFLLLFPGFSLRKKVFWMAIVVAAFSVSFVLTTPGIIFDGTAFLSGIRYQKDQYAGFNSNHTFFQINSKFEYLQQIFGYVALALFSSNHVFSLIIAVSILIGTVEIFRAHRNMGFVLLSFPISYVALFCFQKLFYVRNFMVLVPFLAILSSIGFSSVYQYFHGSFWKKGMLLTMGMIISWNLIWMIQAGERTGKGFRQNVGEQFVSYANSHPNERFILSNGIRKKISSMGMIGERTIGKGYSSHGNGRLVTTPREFLSSNRGSYRFGCIEKWFGPYLANYNYYPTAAVGPDVIFVLHSKCSSDVGS